MLKFLFKNKVSSFGTFLIVGSIILVLYNINNNKHLKVITQTVQNIYTEKEKVEGEFKYGKTNLNIIYLYIETKLEDSRFYIYENIGNDSSSQYLEKVESEIPLGSKISIWVDDDEFKNYKDIEIQKLKIDNNIIVNNSINNIYIAISIIIGLLFLLISKKYYS